MQDVLTASIQYQALDSVQMTENQDSTLSRVKTAWFGIHTHTHARDTFRGCCDITLSRFERSTPICRCKKTILVGRLTPRTFVTSVNIYPMEKRKSGSIRDGLRDPQDKGTMNHRNVGNYLRNDTYRKTWGVSFSIACETTRQPTRNHVQSAPQSAWEQIDTIWPLTIKSWGYDCAEWGTALQARRSRVRYPMASLEFLTQSFRPHCGPGVDSGSITNVYQEYFLGGKGGRCVGLTNLTTFMCRLSWNLGASTSWNPQGLSRSVMGLLYLPFYECVESHLHSPAFSRHRNAGDEQDTCVASIGVLTPRMSGFTYWLCSFNDDISSSVNTALNGRSRCEWDAGTDVQGSDQCPNYRHCPGLGCKLLLVVHLARLSMIRQHSNEYIHIYKSEILPHWVQDVQYVANI